MLDEFEAISGGKAPGFITGKPVGLGGSPGRAEATGYGVIAVLIEALMRLNIEPASATVSIQGFGNVAQHAAKRFVASGWNGNRSVVVGCEERERAYVSEAIGH